MDTINLKTFLVLANRKNFTQTAQELFVAQSTVTNRIAELERELGRKLFIRDKKNVNLTKEGLIFQNYAKRMVELEDQSIKDLHSFCYQNLLRIGTTNTIYESYLYPFVHTSLSDTPNTSVKIILGHTNEILHMLQDGIIDIAYTYLPFSKAGFQCHTFETDELTLVTSYQYEEFKQGIRRDQLSDLKYLMCNFALQEVGIFIRELFPSYYQFPFEIDNSTKLIPYLLDGHGYSFLPHSMVKPYLESKKLRHIPLLDFDTPKITSYAIHHSSNDTARKFVNGGDLLVTTQCKS